MDIDEQAEPSDDTNIRSSQALQDVGSVGGREGGVAVVVARNGVQSTEEEDNLLIEEHGINPDYPRVLVRRLSLPSATGDNHENMVGIAKDNVNGGVVMEVTMDNNSAGSSEIAGQQQSQANVLLHSSEATENVIEDSANSAASCTQDQQQSRLQLSTPASQNSSSSLVQNEIGRVTPMLVNDNGEEQQNQIVEAGIDPNYPIVLVRRLSLNSDNQASNPENNTQEPMQGTGDGGDNSMDSIHDFLILSQNENEGDQQQQIEDAGIDPNYPRVLVRRVSLPTNDDSNGDAPAIDGNNVDESSQSEEDVAENVLQLFPAPEVEEEEEVEADLDSWSEGDDESAIIENPNLREFSNQFVVIRNMIAQTRRSMAETEANFGPSEILPRNMLMQRFRRILFILNNRRRRLIRLGMNTADEENPEGEANAEMEAAYEQQPPEQDQSEDGENNAEEDNMSIGQEEEMNENAVRFDTDLPAEHSYLGPNMNRVSGVNYLDAGQYIKLRLFLHEHVLFPGEVVPFMVDSSTTIIEGDPDEQNGIQFGLCFPSLSNNSTTEGAKNELYGVTCQIYELGTDHRGNTLIKSRALQRFVTNMNDMTVPIEYITSHPRMKCTGFVKILPDIYLPEPLKKMNMGSMNRFRDNASMQKAYRRFQAASMPWPVHVYEAHNMSTIIEKARTQLAQHKINTMPNDPTQLSYWLVRNLHLPEKMLKSVFLANTVNTRLKLIASTFKEEAVFSCRSCGTHIANCRELFAMSKHGVQSQYCNSAGFIHETNTVYQVNRQNIRYNGSPSTEFSWFPGYQWHIIVCKICEHHLGWEFKAVEPNLIPKQFFGISSSSVRVRSANERTDELTQRENAFYNFIRLMNAGVNTD
uniref:Protein cereblon n=1 Tax=Stomoxys calcitrans TaxID=35570 RepID=A0A1I8Q427_STOCA|nr:unnamed protein product [Stomoxys calcitrans]